MTIDEAIKLCEEDAEKIGGNPQSDRHASNCRQLAEWLTELKEAKKLLRYVIEVMNNGSCTIDCNSCKHKGNCAYSERYEWERTDEVLKLIGGEEQ